MYRICSFFFYESSLRRFMHSTEIPLGIFQHRILLWTLKPASITLSCFLYLQHKLWLKIVSVVVAKMSTSQTYQLFSMLHFLFQNYHACSGSTKQKSILIISFIQKSAQFSCPTTKIDPVCIAQNWPNLYGTKLSTQFYCTNIDPIFANIWHNLSGSLLSRVCMLEGPSFESIRGAVAPQWSTDDSPCIRLEKRDSAEERAKAALGFNKQGRFDKVASIIHC